MVVVELYTKMAEFFPCTTSIQAKNMAEIFIAEIFSLHGFPNEIISNCGPQLISCFWKHFLKGLNIKPYCYSGYDPQYDGQNKRVNQILKQYLRCYVQS